MIYRDFTKLINSILLLIFLMILPFACQHNPKESISMTEETKTLAQVFFDTYAARNDWGSFLEFYDSNLIFEDPTLQINYTQLSDFKSFYNWPDTAFQKHENFPKTLILEQLVCQDSIAIGSGYFTPFYYNDTLYGQEEKLSFSIELHFNKAGKIVRQIDRITYPKSLLN